MRRQKGCILPRQMSASQRGLEAQLAEFVVLMFHHKAAQRQYYVSQKKPIQIPFQQEMIPFLIDNFNIDDQSRTRSKGLLNQYPPVQSSLLLWEECHGVKGVKDQSFCREHAARSKNSSHHRPALDAKRGACMQGPRNHLPMETLAPSITIALSQNLLEFITIAHTHFLTEQIQPIFLQAHFHQERHF